MCLFLIRRIIELETTFQNTSLWKFKMADQNFILSYQKCDEVDFVITFQINVWHEAINNTITESFIHHNMMQKIPHQYV